MTRLYISQDRLDAWTSENRITISGDTMTFVENGRVFSIHPAVRFLGVSGASAEDPHDLLNKVKDISELESMGADHMASSVIYEDIAYDVENGFIGQPLPHGPRRGTLTD